MFSSNFTLVIRAEDGSLWAVGLGEDDRNCIPSPVPVQQAINAALLPAQQSSTQTVTSPQTVLGASAAMRKGYQRVTLFDRSPGAATTWSTYGDPRERIFEVVVHEGEAFLHPMDMAVGDLDVSGREIVDVSHGWKHQLGLFGG